ncbi:enoyl-CoA hydratase/isomerase family protein [Microbacterium sp. A93]|uniref:enoyl-CoA hydratase/isomerase family protein n=1 Tax=Microbacterium sp. A93 TaxID=3450716 RepID=UPI003F435911
MSSFETVLLSVDGPTATLTLNRPQAANALSRQLLREAVEAVDEVAANDDVRVLIVTGAGDRTFCGGADLRDMADMTRGKKFHNHGRIITDVIDDLPKPVIAAINGAALGGGCELSIAADFRIMADTAVIGTTEILFGQLPGAGGTVRLPRLIGPARAKEMLYLGRKLDAETALRYGLVNEVVPLDELMTRAHELANELALKAPFALAAAKHLVNEGSLVDKHTALKMETRTVRSMATPEQRQIAIDEASARSETYRKIFAGMSS